MNIRVKNKLTESYKQEIIERMSLKGVKLSEAKIARIVEAAIVRNKYIKAGNKIALFENAATPQNTAGRGSFSLGNNTANAGDTTRGSGEVFDQLFGVFVDAYAATVGFDILHTKQMSKSNLMVSILEPVYAGGRLAGTDATASVLPVFTAKLEVNGAPTALAVGTTYTILDSFGGAPIATVKYVGLDRGDSDAVFQTVSIDAAYSTQTLATMLDTAITGAGIYNSAVNFFGFATGSVDYLNANTNHLQGFSAAGLDDTNNWSTSGHDGQRILSGNSREVGETRDFRTMGFRKWSFNYSAGTHKVKIAFTKEMFQDMLMEEAINLNDMSDVIGTEELSQSINQEILSKVFAHGWSNHKNLNAANGFDCNLNLTNAVVVGGSTFVNAAGVLTTIPNTPAALVSTFQHTIATTQRLLITRIGYAGSVIGNRSRMGKADTVVTGTANVSPISDIRGFREQPFENTLTDNEDVSMVGTFKRMTLFEDTTMEQNDRRVSVSKKGNDKSSGLALCNYILADKVGTVAEGTGEEVSFLYSRMVIAEKGSNPSLNYLTFNVTGANIY